MQHHKYQLWMQGPSVILNKQVPVGSAASCHPRKPRRIERGKILHVCECDNNNNTKYVEPLSAAAFSSMSSLLWPQRRRGPAAVPMDTVIPVHSFDDNKFIRPLVMYLLMRFDDVLDAQALRTSLEKLLSRDGWRRLGARLRLNVGFSTWWIVNLKLEAPRRKEVC